MARKKPTQVSSLDALTPADRLLFEHERDGTPFERRTAEYNNLMGTNITVPGIKSKTTQLKNNQPKLAAQMKPTGVSTDTTKPNASKGDGTKAGKRKHSEEPNIESEPELKKARQDADAEADAKTKETSEGPNKTSHPDQALTASGQLPIVPDGVPKEVFSQASGSGPQRANGGGPQETHPEFDPTSQTNEALEASERVPPTEDEGTRLPTQASASGPQHSTDSPAIQADKVNSAPTTRPSGLTTFRNAGSRRNRPVPSSGLDGTGTVNAGISTPKPASLANIIDEEPSKPARNVLNEPSKVTSTTTKGLIPALWTRSESQATAASHEDRLSSTAYIPAQYTQLAYNARCERGLPYIAKEFDTFPKQAKNEFEALQLSISVTTSGIFDDISLEERQEYRHSFVQHMACKAFDVVQMLTCEDPDAAERALKRCLDEDNKGPNATHSSKITAGDLGCLTLNAILTSMVWSPTLSSQLGIPRLVENDTHFIEFGRLAQINDIEAHMARYKWRDTCRDVMRSAKVQTKCAQLQGQILSLYESCVAYMGRTTQRRLQPELEREAISKLIGQAIDLKCRLELSSNKFEVRWGAKHNDEFDPSTMRLHPGAPKKLGEILHRNMVRVALTPMLYVQEPVHGNENGLDAVERHWLVASLPADEAAKFAFKEPELISSAMVIMWDGPVKK